MVNVTTLMRWNHFAVMSSLENRWGLFKCVCLLTQKCVWDWRAHQSTQSIYTLYAISGESTYVREISATRHVQDGSFLSTGEWLRTFTVHNNRLNREVAAMDLEPSTVLPFNTVRPPTWNLMNFVCYIYKKSLGTVHAFGMLKRSYLQHVHWLTFVVGIQYTGKSCGLALDLMNGQ